MSKKDKERGIEETLRALDITGDDGDGGEPELPPLTPKDQPPGGAFGDDDEGGEEPEDDIGGGTIPGGGFQGGFRIPEPDRPPPLPPAMVPPPQRGRPRKPQAAMGAGKLNKSLAEKVPGADKIKVYQRKEGRRWFIQDYTRADLQQFSDFESFLTRYVKPTYGPGEYDLVGVDGMNREIELGQIRLIADPTTRPETGAFALVEKVLMEQRERDREWQQRTSSMQQNPLELLTGVMALKDKIDGEAGGGLGVAMKAMSESSNQTVQMMMAMMQQNQQMMLALMQKPKEEDPLMKIILAKLLDGGGLGGSGAAPPPPPPPPESRTSELAELLTAMGTFMGSMGGGGDDDFKELLKTLLPQLLLKNNSDGLGTKEVLELVLGNKKSGTDDFRSAIDNMAAIMNVAQNINQGREPGSAAGFFDALAALFSNRDFAGSIAQQIRARTDGKQNTEEARLAAEKQRLAMERRLLQQERARAGIPANTQPQTQHLEESVAPPPLEQPRPSPQPLREPGAPSVSPEQVQQAAQRVVRRTGKIPELPGNTAEHVNNIISAKDEGEQVGKVIAMLIYFAEFEDWRAFSERLLTCVRDGNKVEAMRYLSAFFEGLASIGLFQPEAVPTIVEAVERHFEVVQGQLSEVSTEADREITPEQLTQPPQSEADAPAAES
jgi:hypothetical protein